MNPDSKKFDSLRRLLKLKRHEQPPPGYFNRFSGEVMARIKAGETGNKLGLEPGWIQRVVDMFDVKPVFAGAFGMGVCALLVSGVISSESTSTPMAVSNPSDGSRPSFVVDNHPATATDMRDVSLTSGDTNSISLFNQYQPQFRTENASGPATYWIRNGNN